ncbi:MAG: hypothetical protein HXY48_10750 [Ignavibacteriaceae bacterium]|nr:hypothetical protein [Ignavibacteriaceae bacterium]
MRKAYLLLIPLLIWGCEKTYDNLIDTSTENYQLNSVVGIKDTIDLKTPGDSLLALRLIFTPQSKVGKVYFDIYASDNSRLNSSPVEMQEVTENIFENQFILKRENPIGNYTVRFSASGNQGITKQIAVASFYFNNGQDNVPPVISNLIAPDTVTIGSDTTFIQLNLDVEDANGLSDVLSVWFDSYLPNGNPSSQNPIALYDDGISGGDVTAGDGKYSRIVILPPVGVTKGTYRWEFRARDRSGTLSNQIIHFLVVN